MAQSGAFVLPSGVRLAFDGGFLTIQNDGDIVIEGAPEQSIRSLHSASGSIILGAPSLTIERIDAPNGSVSIGGKLVTTTIRAAKIEFSGASLKASVLKATDSIDLAGDRIEVDVVVAPRVEISSSARGRATAIQSDVEVGPHKLKGGFSLAEFVNLMPGGAELLAEHGIDVPPSDEDGEDEDEEPVPARSKARPTARSAPTPPAPPPPLPTDTPAPSVPEIAALSAPLTISQAEIELEPDPAPEPELAPAAPAKPGVTDEVRTQIKDAVDKIVGAYRNRELPPPIKLLVRMVEEGDLASLKLQINTIWSDLLKYHQQTDPFISNTVSIMFQTIQLLMRKVQI